MFYYKIKIKILVFQFYNIYIYMRTKQRRTKQRRTKQRLTKQRLTKVGGGIYKRKQSYKFPLKKN